MSLAQVARLARQSRSAGEGSVDVDAGPGQAVMSLAVTRMSLVKVVCCGVQVPRGRGAGAKRWRCRRRLMRQGSDLGTSRLV